LAAEKHYTPPGSQLQVIFDFFIFFYCSIEISIVLKRTAKICSPVRRLENKFVVNVLIISLKRPRFR